MRYETALSVILRDHDVELLKAVARDRNMSISALIRHIIVDWMNARYSPHRKAVDDHFARLYEHNNGEMQQDQEF